MEEIDVLKINGDDDDDDVFVKQFEYTMFLDVRLIYVPFP